MASYGINLSSPDFFLRSSRDSACWGKDSWPQLSTRYGVAAAYVWNWAQSCRVKCAESSVCSPFGETFQEEAVAFALWSLEFASWETRAAWWRVQSWRTEVGLYIQNNCAWQLEVHIVGVRWISHLSHGALQDRLWNVRKLSVAPPLCEWHPKLLTFHHLGIY